jgi:glyoxylase-like metal-dependent hydrolase (beta-lactamase superfamily II)
MTATETEPDELDGRLGDDDLLVVDIRHKESYEDWHVPGSRNVDVYDELREEDEAAADALSDLPDDAEVVTVCGVGEVAADATDVLRGMGYDATTLADGMVGWSRVHRTAPVGARFDGALVQVARPGTGCLSHVVVSDSKAAVFDPSSYVGEYESVVADHDASLVGVFDSHAHADHVSGGRALAERAGVPYYLHTADDLGAGATPVEDGDVFGVGSLVVEAVHTPGHSPGSLSFAVRDEGAEEDEALLTGDTLFHDTVGRVELGVEAGIEDVDARDNAETLYASVTRLTEREGDPLVLPAHHSGEPDPPVAARMSEVEERNEGLRRPRDDFVNELADDVPEQPPNFERIKRVNAGAEDADEDEVEDLEAGPNNCAAE